jgi:hypothetical protein
VLVTWRLLDASGDVIGDWSRTLLMPQRRRDAESSIPVYEQIIDARDRTARRPDDQQFTFEYKVSTRDDRTSTSQIKLVRPPTLIQTQIDLQVPAYALQVADTGVIASGKRAPERPEARIAPILEGTKIQVQWTFSKPIELEDAEPQWVRRLRTISQLDSFTRPDESTVEITLTPSESLLIEPVVLDRTGVPVREPIALALEVVGDLAPSARLIEPLRDEQVTPQAQIDLLAELSDDLGLTRGMLTAQVSSPPQGSSGAPPEPIGEPIQLAEITRDLSIQSTLAHMIDFGSLELQPGDELRVWASAWDLRSTSDTTDIGFARSGDRVFRIVAEEEIVEQIRRSLDPIRSNLRSIDERQGEVQGLVRTQSPRAADEQRSLSERLRANQNALDQLNDSISRNQIGDVALAQTVADAQSVIDEAASQSEQAEDQIRRGEEESASKSQRQVRNRLGQLLSMLDQGQDAWLALRNVQQVRSELEDIQEQTQELAQRTAGQSLDEMSQEDRSALEQILERQMENAEDAREAINTLDERADELQENDPTQAEALRRAAQQARAAQLEQKLRDAGAQISQNQTGSASQTQEEVLEELEELLEELENTVRNRDSALRRELADIMQALGRLIDAQEQEVIRFDAMMLDNAFVGMDQRLITLVGNTLSVRDEALGAFPETRSIADHITRAANAQSNAINLLRAAPIEPQQVQLAQNTSLTHLKNALEEAQRLDDQAAQRQLERARDELRKRYEQALDTQTRLRDETEALGSEVLSRRERSRARAINAEQRVLGEELAAMLNEQEGLADAPVFALAHAQLDRLMTRAAEGLTQRSIDRSTHSSQVQAMSILASLIDVLKEQQQEQQDFEDGSSQGQGNGNQQGGDEPLIPPVAELKLLRSMQQLVMDQTRFLAETESPDASEIEAIGSLQKELYEQGTKLIESMNPAQPEAPMPMEGEDSGNSEPIQPVENVGVVP